VGGATVRIVSEGAVSGLQVCSTARTVEVYLLSRTSRIGGRPSYFATFKHSAAVSCAQQTIYTIPIELTQPFQQGLTLKFFSFGNQELLIYRIQVFVQPISSPPDITSSSVTKDSIDMNVVMQMLRSVGASPPASTFSQITSDLRQPLSTTLAQSPQMDAQMIRTDSQNEKETQLVDVAMLRLMEQRLEQLIEMRFRQFEEQINARLTALETKISRNEKLFLGDE